MKRKPEWKQLNPRDQAIAILSGVEGHLSNLEDGTTPVHKVDERLKHCMEQVMDAIQCLRACGPGQFEE